MTDESKQPHSTDEGQESATVTVYSQSDIPNVNNPPADNQSNSDDKCNASGIPALGEQVESLNQPKRNQKAASQEQGECTNEGEVIGIQRDLAKYTRQLAVFTFFLVLATLALAGIGAAQLYWFRITVADTGRAAEAAQKSADAARDTVNSMNDAAERQLRAYVSIVKAEMVIRGMKLHIILTAKNSGHTPAHDVISWSKPSLQSSKQPFTEPDLGEEDKSPMVFIGPGDTRILRLAEKISKTKNSGTVAELESGQTVLYVSGRMTYKDVFCNVRHTEFRMSGFRNENGEWGFQAEPEGNKAD